MICRPRRPTCNVYTRPPTSSRCRVPATVGPRSRRANAEATRPPYDAAGRSRTASRSNAIFHRNPLRLCLTGVPSNAGASHRQPTQHTVGSRGQMAPQCLALGETAISAGGKSVRANARGLSQRRQTRLVLRVTLLHQPPLAVPRWHSDSGQNAPVARSSPLAVRSAPHCEWAPPGLLFGIFIGRSCHGR
jgi:hypothetical protein